MKRRYLPMTAMRDLQALLARAMHQVRCRCARLPWKELESEAVRQGCSAADIFFDWAGRDLPVYAHRDRIPG
jgi:hypothetical protein